MMKKLLTLVVLALMGTTMAMAQKEKGLGWAVEGGIGSELELGGRAQYGFNQYLAWDVLNVKYAFDYGKDFNAHEWELTTGLRGFSPSFGPNLKAFAALDLGYGGQKIATDGIDAAHCFALDFTVGLQVYKGLYLGYGFGGLFKNGSHKDHLLRVGYMF
ncbi:MAG TPA: hypothetical protein DC006_01070 [Prevotellaceae bacterium]|nr:hypothetical protein [Prevotellaceae bacterium]HBE55582.1 hypothetical protein [Prevotellaceae bacterium]